ncbi:MAG TPA: hypothetical protein VM096_01120 [Vicinamibacterales bacterium]|nr:hypothetical protein [Vicinamibacterales bacterium]
MLAELTMFATLPVDEALVQEALEQGEVRAQQPETPHPIPGLPTAPENPVLPPDDPHSPDVGREPSIDPPSIEPPVEAPSQKPGISEPPSPRA